MKSISDFRVNKKLCITCPFGENGDRRIRQDVEKRVLESSQICHHTHKTLCRGARNHQLEIFSRMKIIAEPTDEAWDLARKKYNC